ncbi:hypothetical protein [Oceanobacillus salinisoli]|uniref:hypothetical protein n=1 Tax=Oceanobacillus salinisoli TaxID=2678611 RepID=UPI0012E0E7D3|nr:hypothetical protein [Oceanobacillus salinisoli]
MLKIKAQDIFYSKETVVHSLSKVEQNLNFTVESLVYYPYMFYEFSFQRKNPISPLKGKVGCTVDGVSGVPALTDKKPEFLNSNISKERLVPIQLDEQKARDTAEEFLYRTISKKIKVISTPNISLKDYELFYWPYWVVNGNKGEENLFTLIVDSITGKYHPLNVE